MKLPNSDVRLALIGCGRWGRNYIKTVGDFSGAVLTCAASSNPETKKLVSADCVVVADWRELITRDDIDGVIIATPPASHFEIASNFIEAGFPVLIEKPLTMDIEEAEGLLAIADKSNATVMVDHIHLFHPAYRMLKQRAKSHGDIRKLFGRAGNWGPFRNDTPLLWDWGAHDVALCLDLMGALPDRVHAKKIGSRKIEDGFGETVSIEIAFQGGATGDIEISNLKDAKERMLRVEWVDTALIYDDVGYSPLIYESRSDVGGVAEISTTPIDVKDDLPLNIVIRDFSESIRSGVRQLDDLNLGVNVVRVLDRLQTSLTNESVVTM